MHKTLGIAPLQLPVYRTTNTQLQLVVYSTLLHGHGSSTFQVYPAAHHGGLDSTAKRTWTSCRGQRTTHLGAGGGGGSTRTGSAALPLGPSTPRNTTMPATKHNPCPPQSTTYPPTWSTHTTSTAWRACAHTPASERWEQQNRLHKQLDLRWQAQQEQQRNRHDSE